MNTHTKRAGFTIVELLIVIVVIAILAAISIVAYSGIQQRARTSASLDTATMVAGKAMAWDAIEGSYPDLAQLRTNTKTPTDMDTGAGAAGPQEARLARSGQAIGAEITAVRSEDGTVVTYEPCSGGDRFSGARVSYWDFSANAAVVRVVGTC